MRTDVKISTKRKIRCPQIPVCSVGRPMKIGHGDYIEWKWDDYLHWGRVIGIVTGAELKKPKICVMMSLLGGTFCERWVDPEDVTNTSQKTRDWSILTDWEGKTTDELRKGSWG